MSKNNYYTPIAPDEWNVMQPPLKPTYSAIHLPNGKLTIFGRKYMMRKMAAEHEMRRGKHESAPEDEKKV